MKARIWPLPDDNVRTISRVLLVLILTPALDFGPMLLFWGLLLGFFLIAVGVVPSLILVLLLALVAVGFHVTALLAAVFFLLFFFFLDSLPVLTNYYRCCHRHQ